MLPISRVYTFWFVLSCGMMKAVGEPPLFLAASVFFAIREAIASARADAGSVGYFPFDSPATCERIRLACQDAITEKVYATILLYILPNHTRKCQLSNNYFKFIIASICIQALPLSVLLNNVHPIQQVQTSEVGSYQPCAFSL